MEANFFCCASLRVLARERELPGILSNSPEMKPAPFEYVAPRSLDEALAALAAGGPDAKVLAGGQSLVPLLNFRLARPSLLVDLNRVPELSYIRGAERGVAIGAMTRQAQIERDALLARSH